MKALLYLGILGVVGAATVGALVLTRDDGPAAAPVEEVRGIVFGSVETVDGQGVDAAEVVVTAVGTGQELGRATTDELGLFDVDLGSHDGPVIMQATRQAETAATVVAVSADGATTGLRLTIGAAGTGSVDGRVVTEDGSPLAETGVVEARFVESGRSAVAGVNPDGTFRVEGLPLDGDLVVVATAGQGGRQGLVATAVSESVPTNTAEVALGAEVSQAAVGQVEQPEIVTDDLGDWTVDGPVTVIPTDELG